MKTEYLLEVSDTNYEARKNDEFLSKLRRIQSLLIMNGTLEDSNMGVNSFALRYIKILLQFCLREGKLIIG